MYLKSNRWIWMAVCFLLLAGCHSKSKDKPTQKPSVTPPAFDVDSAYGFVKAQTDFGPRVMGSDAHEECARYLLLKLSGFCDTAFVQAFTARTYDGKSWPALNIIGSFAPEKTERVVLASHWDSRPFADHDPNPANRGKAIDGANDGASGVGVLLEVARRTRLSVSISFSSMQKTTVPKRARAPLQANGGDLAPNIGLRISISRGIWHGTVSSLTW